MMAEQIDRLDYAKKHYPIGTIVIQQNPKMIFEVGEEPYLLLDNIVSSTPDKNIEFFIYRNGQWAEIVSNNHELVKSTENISHQQAIEGLKMILKSQPLPYHKTRESLEYAINQLDGFELYSKPKMMIVSVDELFDITHRDKVLCKTPWGYLVKDVDGDWQMWEHAKPIEEKPLSFTEWLEKEFPYNRVFGLSELEPYYEGYTEYLKQFEKNE